MSNTQFMYKVKNSLYEPVTRDILYNMIPQEDILRKYTESDVIPDGKPTIAKYRQDNKPSLSFRYDGQILICADWGTGFRGDSIMFVRERYNLSYSEAIKKILNDFNIIYSEQYRSNVSDWINYNSHNNISNYSNKIITTKRKQFTPRELNYWNEYGITKETLNDYHIYSLSHVFLDNKIVAVNRGQLLFGYYCGYNNWRIYQPENTEYRWFGTLPLGTVFGWKQLKLKDTLFITSSLKDVCTLRELGYDSVAPVNELCFMSDERFNRLRSHYKNIILFFNNDTPGINSAKKYSMKYNIPYIHLPLDEPKDPSDYVKKYSLNDLKNQIKNLISLNQK